jgi:hypothetical protein
MLFVVTGNTGIEQAGRIHLFVEPNGDCSTHNLLLNSAKNIKEEADAPSTTPNTGD